jgi:hypothetical protein
MADGAGAAAPAPLEVGRVRVRVRVRPSRFSAGGVAIMALLCGVLALSVGSQSIQTAVNGTSGGGGNNGGHLMPQELAHWLAEQYVAFVREELPSDKREAVRQKLRSLRCARAMHRNLATSCPACG